MGAIGIAQMGVELRVADADDRPLPPGATGEVLVRGDPVMRGYWRNPRHGRHIDRCGETFHLKGEVITQG